MVLLASLIQVPLLGGYQGINARIHSPGQVRPAYRAVAGNVYVDTTPLACTEDRIVLHASTGFGTVSLYVPFDAQVIVSGKTGIGTLSLGTRSRSSLDVAGRAILEPRFGHGPTIVADLAAGLGNVEVFREGLAKRHPFDPISVVLGLFVTTLGLVFVFGDRSAGEIGARWLWPFPVVVAGLVAVLAAIRMTRGRDRADEASEPDVADGRNGPDEAS
jgi:hypothetical protein